MPKDRIPAQLPTIFNINNPAMVYTKRRRATGLFTALDTSKTVRSGRVPTAIMPRPIRRSKPMLFRNSAQEDAWLGPGE